MASLRRAVFLDRDGVLNEVVLRDGKPYPPDSLSEFRLVSDVDGCLADLKQKGFLLIVVTNQPDVARGKQKKATVEEMHAYLTRHLPIDDTFVCYHDDSNHCGCRKPLPGLMLEAASKYGIELEKSYLVGDRWRDVEAGQNANCKTVFLNNGYAEKQPKTPASFETRTLRGAVDWILSNV